MKTLLLCLFLLATIATQAHTSVHMAVTGTHPGEIYFSGWHPDFEGALAFYYSADSGQTIEMRDYVTPDCCDVFPYGSFLPDAADSTLSRFWYWGQHLTTDGGFTWNLINPQPPALCSFYASGVISGEIYRESEEPDNTLERSTNFGQEYAPCRTAGIPGTIPYIEDIALGSDSGEVYVWAWQGLLFYSADYADSFSFLIDLHTVWAIPPTCKILNGAQPGEVYVYFGLDSPNKYLWRVCDYGDTLELVGFFPLSYGTLASPAISKTPGELFLVALSGSQTLGGLMHVYHTTNFGQDWTMYEHIVPYQGVMPAGPANSANASLEIWPNQANAALTVSYSLPAPQIVALDVYNIIGQSIWHYHARETAPGLHRLSFSADQLPSGRYILTLQIPEGRIQKPLIILK